MRLKIRIWHPLDNCVFLFADSRPVQSVRRQCCITHIKQILFQSIHLFTIQEELYASQLNTMSSSSQDTLSMHKATFVCKISAELSRMGLKFQITPQKNSRQFGL